VGEELVVVALGGNAISPPGSASPIPAQYERTLETAEHLAHLTARPLVVTHGNGPQVGNVLLRSDLAADLLPRLPLDTCVADTQGGMGFMLQMQQFQKERLIASVLAYTGAERMIAMTIDYLRERKTFGAPLIENQWIYFKMSELITDVEMLRQMCYHCVRRLVAGEDVTREASMAKYKAGQLSRAVADTCLQFHGGYGYMEEYRVSRYYRDARLLPIGGGADESMLGIIAKYEGILPERRAAKKA
jgi:alkylation response protein AidB-like acyl-CoA dehydrogenase